MISVPRRELDGKLQPLLAAGISQLSHHITLALFPRTVLDRIVRICRRPHTEAAMVFGGEDDTPHTGLFAHPRPLPAVEAGGIKQLRVLIAETPLLIGIRVQRIVDKRVHLHILPAQLVLAGHRTERFWFCYLCR